MMLNLDVACVWSLPFALPRGVGMAIEVLFSSSPSCQDQPRVYLMSLPSGKRLPMGKWENIGKPIGKWRFTLW